MSALRQHESETLQFKTKVVIITDEDELIETSAKAGDITIKGIYLIPKKKLPINTRCILDITVTGSASKIHVTTPARICDHDPRGMQITFIDMDIISFVHLKTLVAIQAPEGQRPAQTH